ncbi:MAG: LL-diaminopimelate aminotransferase [Planctomycetes bacterium]|nr:LL-diaminopimelate aminotransferase [Planctomycetota bacterium]MBM4057584.1 LL-diaminopimelate aminotransferase [Planctomycetota bacterium]
MSAPTSSATTTPADPWFQDRFAQRIGGAGFGKGTAIYKFELIKRAKRQALAEHPERRMLDFGIGENDEMAPESVRAVMRREVDRPENRGYADNGIAVFKEAAAAFMQREFGITLDPVTEVNHCIGSKTAYAMLPAAFIDPGDVTLMTVPGYPVAGTATKWFGGTVHPLPLVAERGFLPDLDGIPAGVLARTKLLVLCYPNSPTGGTATRAFYERVVDWAHRHRVVVIQDAAHIMLSYDDEPLSFLSVDGAKEVGLEVHSLSKGFHMIGWRMGWVCGHERLVRAFADVKDNCDSGQFMAIQQAAAAALADPEIPRRVREKYRRRLEKLVGVLRAVGFECEMPGGTYFLYTRSPVGAGDRVFATAQEASQFLIHELSISTVPWDDCGASLRFSATYEAEDEGAEDDLMAETHARLTRARLKF